MVKKTRITKAEVIAYREQQKIPSYKHKKTIKPGPWTELNPKFKVKVTLRPHTSIIPNFPAYQGLYKVVEDWTEKGWYPIVFNIQVKDLLKLVAQHGLDLVLAAIEKALNTAKTNKKPYGDIILTYAWEPVLDQNYISCEAKTNKKYITGFAALRTMGTKKELKVL